MSQIFYAESSGTFTTAANVFTAMPMLPLELPAGTSDVILTLNVPNPYASGNNFPGGFFGVFIDGNIQAPIGCFSYDEVATGGGNRIPVTVVCHFKLDRAAHKVQAVWMGVRSCTVHIDSPVSLSAIIVP